MSLKRLLPFALAALLLLTAGRRLLVNLQSFGFAQISGDEATAWDARMRSVAAALPAEVHVVGYLDDTDLDPSIPRRIGAEFYLTQYGLAPVVMHVGTGPEWIVANLGNSLSPREIRSGLSEKLGSYTIREFGFGMYLIHRTPG